MRTLCRMAVLVVCAVVAAGCGSGEPPLKVGVLVECTGLLESAEEGLLAGAQLPLIERGARLEGEGADQRLVDADVGGRPVEIVKGCVELTTLAHEIVETRRLIEEEHVDVVIGPVGETEGVVLSKLAGRYPDVTFLLAASVAQEATLRPARPNVFRFLADGPQTAAGLATFAYRDLGWRNVDLVEDPVAGAWEGAAGFAEEFCALGGRVRSAGLLTMTPADKELAQRVARGSDGVALFAGYYDTEFFLRGYRRSASPVSRRLLISGYAFSLPRGLSPGDVDLSGVVIGGDIPVESESPRWLAYRRAYRRAFPGLPVREASGQLVLPTYVSMEAVVRALEAVDGDAGPHGRDLRAALSRLAFETPMGPVRLNANRQAIVSVHLRQVEGRGRAARTRPLRIVRGVEQSFGGAFSARTPPPALLDGSCRRGPVPPWARQ